MNKLFKKLEYFSRKTIIAIVLVAFCFNMIIPPNALAQVQFSLPQPGAMIGPSVDFAPSMIKGIKLYPDNPLKFDFVVDTGNTEFNDEDFKSESEKLIKYFMASLTVPEEDIWVNLSPYEKDRIVPDKLGTTEMGRDLLAQDYILKQLTSSLMYPEDELGQKFWNEVYKEAYDKYGVTDIPFDTFNKVWIVPKKAVVYTNKNMAFVVESKLKVMLDKDYKALARNKDAGEVKNAYNTSITADIIRKIIIPAIEHEVNAGKNFTSLRQIYNSMILATWFKRNLKQSIFGKVYVGTNKVKGIDLKDKNIKEKIYQQYLEAFKKGVYNYVKEDFDPVTQQIIPRKYFSGGFMAGELLDNAVVTLEKTAKEIDSAMIKQEKGKYKTVSAGLTSPTMKTDSAMVTSDLVNLNMDRKGIVTEDEFINMIRNTPAPALQDLMPIIRSSVKGFDERVLRGVSDKEAEELFKIDEDFAVSLGCKRRTETKADGNRVDAYEGFGYIHAYEGHNGEFKDLDDFDQSLKDALDGKGFIILSRNNFIEIKSFKNKEKDLAGQFSILVTKADGEMVTFYVANNKMPVGKDKQKALLNIIENLTRDLNLPMYVPDKNAAEAEKNKFYIKVYEGYFFSYFLQYDMEANGSSSVSSFALTNQDIANFLIDKNKEEGRKTISKNISNFYKKAMERNLEEFSVSLDAFDTEKENSMVEEKIQYFTKLSKEELKDQIRKMYEFFNSMDYRKLSKGVRFLPSDIIFLAAVLLDPKEAIKTKDIFRDWIQFYPLGNEDGSAYLEFAGAVQKLINDKERLKVFSIDLMRERYSYLKEVFGPGLFRIFDVFKNKYFMMRFDAKTEKFSPGVSDKEFFREIRSIDPDKAKKVVVNIQNLVDAKKMAGFLEGDHKNYKYAVANIAESPFYNLNDEQVVKNIFNKVISLTKNEGRLKSTLDGLLKEATGLGLKDLQEDKDKVAVYSDEIAGVLYQLFKNKQNKNPLRSAKSISEDELLKINEMLQHLYVRKNIGIEFELMKRNFDEVNLGKVFGDCTAPPSSLGEEEGVKYEQYFDSWFFDPNFQILKLFYTKEGRRSARMIMKVHLVKARDSKSGEEVLIVDAHEVIPTMVKENESYDKELGAQKTLFFHAMIDEVFEFAKKNGINKVYANKISNDGDTSFGYKDFVDEEGEVSISDLSILKGQYQTQDKLYRLKQKSLAAQDQWSRIKEIVSKLNLTMKYQDDFFRAFNEAMEFLDKSKINQGLLTYADVWRFFKDNYARIKMKGQESGVTDTETKKAFYVNLERLFSFGADDVVGNGLGSIMADDVQSYILELIKEDTLDITILSDLIYWSFRILDENNHIKDVSNILLALSNGFESAPNSVLKERFALSFMGFLDLYPRQIDMMSKNELKKFFKLSQSINVIDQEIIQNMFSKISSGELYDGKDLVTLDEMRMIAKIHAYFCLRTIHEKMGLFGLEDPGVVGFLYDEKDYENDYLDALGFWNDLRDIYGIIKLKDVSNKKILKVITPLWFKEGSSVYATTDFDFSRSLTQTDSAQITGKEQTEFKKGGIDLNPNKIDIEEKGNGIEFNVPFDPAMIDATKFEGFTPVIIQITPTDLPLLLGMSNADRQTPQKISKI